MGNLGLSEVLHRNKTQRSANRTIIPALSSNERRRPSVWLYRNSLPAIDRRTAPDTARQIGKMALKAATSEIDF
jgi:hypothetical protein